MMKAVIMEKAGDVNILEMRNIDIPVITSSTEILVELKAAGVNPIDIKIRKRGTFYPEFTSAILGCDGAGIVVDIGKEVTRFKPGDEVYFCAGGLGKANTGNYAQYTVVEQDYVAKKPQSLSFAEAATVPLVLITAWESLCDRISLNSNDKILIHGGAGGVGHISIQLAKLKGVEVATTVSNPDKERLVRKLGANYPILYQQTNFINAVMDWTKGKGVDSAFDTIGGKIFFDTCHAVKVYGDIVTILEPDCTMESLKIARNRNLRISLELMLTPALMNLTEALRHQRKILEQGGLLFDQGKLTIHLEQTFSLAEASTAHKMIETGSVTGKIALII